MPFDPTKPAASSPNSSAEMRAQLNALHDEIAAAAGVTGAQVDTTNTGAPGSSATASVSLNGGVLHFDFTIPAGQNGEVTQAQLSNDLVNCQNAAVNTALPLTSNNSNGVGLLGMTISDPPTQGEVQNIANRLDELINALRR